MGMVLLIVGLLWAFGGVYNIVANYDATRGRENMMAFIMVMNAVIYILPGLVLAGIGVIIRQRSTAGLVSCPHCAEKIRPQAKVCRFCQRDVPAVPASAASIRPSTTDIRPGETVHCGQCGRRNELRGDERPGEAICRQCGGRLSAATGPGPAR